MANTYTAIATVTATTSVANIEFTSIPATYTDLVIQASIRDNDTGKANDMTINFNSSSSNFTGRRIYGSGSSVVNDTTAPYAGSCVSDGATSNTFSNNQIYIPNYTNANYKSFSIESVCENNGTEGYNILYAGLWSDTAAITNIKIIPKAAISFKQYSTATLYGIKNS